MIYLTGHRGFIGKNIINCLESEYTFRKIKYSEPESSTSGITKNSVPMLIHTAWIGVAGAERNSDSQSRNVELTHSLCDLILEKNIKRLIAFGSQAEYGIHNKVLSEECTLNPLTKYGYYKCLCHEIFKERLIPYDVEVIWLRLFDAYGPYDKPHWLIPHVINSALANQDAALTECDQYWDFLYASDVVNAVKSLIEMTSSIEKCSTYNLSSGIPIRLSEIVDYIYQSISPLNGKALYGVKRKRAEEISFLCGSNLALTNATGWKPTQDIYSGIVKTIEWHKSNAP